MQKYVYCKDVSPTNLHLSQCFKLLISLMSSYIDSLSMLKFTMSEIQNTLLPIARDV